MSVTGPANIMLDLNKFDFQKFALLMGLVYYIELIFWFNAVRHIDISVASSITVPAPALTMALAITFLHDSIETYQLITLAIVIVSI